MSFPNIIYGDYGDEKVTSSTKIGSLPLGAVMILPDGSSFCHGKASATAMVAGDLYQQNAMGVIAGTADVAFNGTLAAAAAAIGATQVTVTLGGTASVTKDLLADGILWVADSAGIGHNYRIKSHPAAAAGSTCVITLDPGDPIKVALAAASTKVGLRQNPYDNLTLVTADTVGVGAIAGIAPVAVTASYYCWIQRKGPAPALTDNTTLIVGLPVTASTTVAGAVAVWPTAAADTAGVRAAKGAHIIGTCMSVAASAKCSLVNLALD